MSLSVFAFVLLLNLDPMESAMGLGDREQGVFLRPEGLVTGGRRGGGVPIRVLPGDPPLCFDVAIGPMTLPPGAVPPSPAQLGVEIFLMEVAPGDAGMRGPVSIDDWQAFVPLSSVKAGLHVRWVDDDSENSFVGDVEAYSIPGTTWTLARACLESDPSFKGDYWLTVKVPAAALEGVVVGEAAPSASGRVVLNSAAFRVEFGPAYDPGRSRDEVHALRYRAQRLGLRAEEADLDGRLAEIAHDDRWHGFQADLLCALGRGDEALPLWARAVAACDARGEWGTDAGRACGDGVLWCRHWKDMVASAASHCRPASTPLPDPGAGR